MSARSEFSVPGAYSYDQRSPLRWVASHAWRYKRQVLTSIACFIIAWIVYARVPLLIGRAAEELLSPSGNSTLGVIALTILALLVTDGIAMLLGSFSAEQIASKIAADGREELYASLLGKSQTYHDRQRVGDIMARATDDVNQLSSMIVPGTTLTFETVMGVLIPTFYIATLNPELILVPLGFTVCYIITIRRYMAKLNPVARKQRDQFGVMNARLEETISGIAIVKASAQEAAERRIFRTNARLFRDSFVRQGVIEARYLPLLIFAGALGLGLLHALTLYQQGRIGLAEVIAFMGLMNVLRFPVFISVFSFGLLQAGIASAERILEVIRADTDLDENSGGFEQQVQGAITFEEVSFGYGDKPVLDRVSFRVEPGQTVAIVGQTGSGKSTLTQLVNRTYDATHGRVLIDGVDVRDWRLTGLRSQIAKIEQDVFLFSRTIAENIAFGAPGASREQIEQAAREAQAHDFISGFSDGYETMVGERGVTLSGGQRQRIALARAFLNNPRILILDDSTSAIDSATEDEIQKAIRRAQQGRTTLLITHRLSQIRWADYILVLEGGRVVAGGNHEELLHSSPQYRRIFARYDVALPPLEAEEALAVV